MMKKNIFKKPTWAMLSLGCIFIVPLLLAWAMAAKHKSLTHITTNYGELIVPPLQLSKLLPQQEKDHHWLLLYVNSTSRCDTQCEKVLYYLKQIQTATGKDKSRIERAILTLSDRLLNPHILQTLLKAQFPGTLYLTVSSQQLASFLKNDTLYSAIYLVDPPGNIFMFYPLETKPMGIYKDLAHVLKISSIG